MVAYYTQYCEVQTAYYTQYCEVKGRRLCEDVYLTCVNGPV